MDTTEAKHRFASAAEKVEHLQKQLEAYKSSLDILRETASSTDEVAEASRDLVLSYMEMQDEQEKLIEEITELRQHISSLQEQTEEAKKNP